jgi:nitroimidazol reductase NimA-like FMN-containing flavoprotein (pyridoxamine 5'-phosphate oxidase superfamily)
MRRRDKEITSRQELDAIIRACLVCRLAFADGNEPYMVPVSFGYEGECFYFHTAASGRKLDFITRNSRVCFELEKDVHLVPDPDQACKWTFSFETVIGYGTVTELTSTESKSHGLDAIMQHYSGRSWQLDPAALGSTRVWSISIESLTGKRSLPKQSARNDQE